MKQQVNLYELRFRREAATLGATRMLQIFAVALLALLLAGGLAALGTRSGETRVAELEGRRSVESARVVELASLHPAPEADARLEREVTRLAAERDAKTELLQLLGSDSLGNVRGFSESVAALARRRVAGLWLRQVHIRAGGEELSLVGSALAPELLPRLLQALAEEESFAGRAFRSVQLERHAEDARRLDFALHTRPETAP